MLDNLKQLLSISRLKSSSPSTIWDFSLFRCFRHPPGLRNDLDSDPLSGSPVLKITSVPALPRLLPSLNEIRISMFFGCFNFQQLFSWLLWLWKGSLWCSFFVEGNLCLSIKLSKYLLSKIQFHAFLYIYLPPTKLRKGNVFTCVCHSVHGG